MIQLNLLPDVKLEYIHAQRQRRLVLTVSVLVTAAAIALLVLLLFVNVFQKKHLNDLTNDIKSDSATLKSKPQISKVLTVQNQLASLTQLHADKPAAINLFDYLNQTTPTKVSISNFHIDFTTQQIVITGSTDSLSTVNKYVDTLKFTKYTTDSESKETKAFSNIVLSSFGVSTASSGSPTGTSYSITLNYDKPIFDVTKKVTLAVPNTVTTRSALDQPNDLFQAAPAQSTPKKEGN